MNVWELKLSRNCEIRGVFVRVLGKLEKNETNAVSYSLKSRCISQKMSFSDEKRPEPISF